MLSANADERKIQFCTNLDDLIAFAVILRDNAEKDVLTKSSYDGLVSCFHRTVKNKSDFVEFLCERGI